GRGESAGRRDIRCLPEVDGPGCCDAELFSEGLQHDSAQVLVDDVLVPEEGRKVLYPLEVRGRPPAGIAENVWNHEHATLVEDVVRGGRGWAVSFFCAHTGFCHARLFSRYQVFLL